ncbi:P-loop containing nucleoside triphosphate hydrolase protein [Dioscorea alata]|uniref:P-loop containing nucleoside triphosphate hydrolase protein n=1 Tax=Dioscorea alata TaxID=55571 RepID=A0ACB7VRA6_DIOAL|nr:P-loop containing nucleoside triphosphate hydrolase protein [Dioscorea alata]
MTGVGEIFVSSILQALIAWFIPYFLDELKKYDLDLGEEVDELFRSLSSIKGDLEDVDRREEISNTKTWLHCVQDVLYDANDLLDEIAAEMLRHHSIEFLPDVREKLSPLSIRRAAFKRKASNRLRDIKLKLNEIKNEIKNYLMRELSNGGRSTRKRESSQTICLEQGPFYGRGDDVKFIIGWITEEYSPANFHILSIQGMAGVGKTRLAKKVFNEMSLASQFDMKIWVHTPQDTDVKELFKSIMESVTHIGVQLSGLNTMHCKLQELLGQKRYLLVLDEMSVESDHYWENLKTLLSIGAANGSKVLITTCKRSVAYLADALPYQLEALSESDSLRLFNFHALGGPNPEADQNLNEIPRRILEKCKGLPSALVAFGRSLDSKGEPLLHRKGLDQWERVAMKEAGEVIGLNSEIFHTMSSAMKICFAYCSTFPPGFQFKKEMLVQLWMAQNFVHEEDDGSELFDDMYNCSLFECLDYDYRKTQQTYVMHDIIRGIAQLMADEQCCMVGHGNTHNICHRTRHVSIAGNPNNPINVDFKSVYVAKGLHSLLLLGLQNMDKVNLGNVLDDLATKLARLRSLDLSNTSIEELPHSIGNLGGLRYLALGNTGIKKLPESVGKLYHLQTLGLANCYELATLPSGLKNLVNLKHLDLHLDNDSKASALKCMPPHMSKLGGLRTLSRFVASNKDHCRVSELRAFTKLRDLSISNLDSVDVGQAQAADLAKKDHLRVLELQWDIHQRITTGDETNVLVHLRPHTNLKELTIKGYAGYSFPKWMAAPSFPFLATLKLIDCKACTHLPHLGHLPALQQLFIKGMDGIETIDCSLCGRTGASTEFRSLKKMQLESMHNLQTWIGDQETCNFPSLSELTIRDCEKLTQISHSLKCLTKLEIIRCSNLHGLRRFPSLSSLDVRESGVWIWTSLRCLPSLSSMRLTSLPMMAPPVAMQPHTTIRRFEIISCGTPEYLPDNWLPKGLTHLLIKHCPNLRALPRDLHKVETLQVLKVQDCERLELLGERMGELWSLRSIHLSNCPMVSNLPSDGLPAGLHLFTVDQCPNLGRWIRSYWTVAQEPTVLIDGAQLWSSTPNCQQKSTSNF